ncbi:MAG: N-6 DNA methylase [Ruminococcus flavefaciens]|nr:N-6 DNA methylase [Ruminococcus flavefaciens]
MELKALCETTTELFGIENISELSDRLLSVCLENKHEYMEKFAECVGDLSVDWLQKIFQYYEADRKEKMQDYTPLTLARFVGKLTETDHEKAVYDLCAGSGALTIQKWNLNHDLFFVCYEYDKKVIPLLLFNLAVRNINALVVNGDALQDEVFTRYTVKSGEKYGTVKKHEEKVFYDLPDSCISNPPYNMKWKLPPFAQLQPRFNDCELPPESNANFAFILTALDRCKGKAVMILPNGVLSTDNPQEKVIRRYLIEQNLIAAVISCPDKMFEATSIATCILVLNKQKATTHIAFVDMRQTFETEQREQNGQFGGASHENRTYKKEVKIFTDEQIQKAIDSINNQSAIPEFSKAVSIQTIAENDFILIPSRYIEFQEQEFKHREYAEIVADINRITAEKNACKLTINESLAKTLGFDIELYKQDQQDSGLNELLKSLGAEPLTKQSYFTTSKNKNEIKFENNSKDIVSSVLMMVMNTWRQHIYYLNNEENRYLAELRDALLPDLMSGKIDLEGVGDLG